MDEIKEIKNRLAVEYHSGHMKVVSGEPIINWRQALKDIDYLLSKNVELEEGIKKIIESEYMNSLVIKDKLKKLVRNNPT